ncbi:MAG: hypothetical protein AAB875_06985 [Patescibacteria group bacterium]
MKYKLVYIKWEDAFHQEPCQWENNKGIKAFIEDTDFIVESVGWIVHEDKRMITISPMRSLRLNSWSHLQRIPIGTIIKKRGLKI